MSIQVSVPGPMSEGMTPNPLYSNAQNAQDVRIADLYDKAAKELDQTDSEKHEASIRSMDPALRDRIMNKIDKTQEIQDLIRQNKSERYRYPYPKLTDLPGDDIDPDDPDFAEALQDRNFRRRLGIDDPMRTDPDLDEALQDPTFRRALLEKNRQLLDPQLGSKSIRRQKQMMHQNAPDSLIKNLLGHLTQKSVRSLPVL